MKPIRVAIVDDHPIFRMGLAAAIEEMEGIELAGQAELAGGVEELVVSTHPDIVLLDVRLPDGSGLEVNRWIRRHHPEMKVIMLTMSEDHDTILTALRDGASGYLEKGAGPERVEQALHTVAAGDSVLNAGIVQALSELAVLRTPSVASRSFPELTHRELDILDLVASGMDNQAIARELVLSPKTVRNHVSNVLAKIHAADRAQAIVLARQAGLGGETGR